MAGALALGAGEASAFFSFAETLRGVKTARAATQTLLMISDLFFIVGLVGFLSRTRAALIDGAGAVLFMV